MQARLLLPQLKSVQVCNLSDLIARKTLGLSRRFLYLLTVYLQY